jgi:mono/diheme cytochrome c family protein
MKRLSFLGFLMGSFTALFLAAGTPLGAQPASSLPQGEGRDLVATACSQCHGLSPIIVEREGPAGWKRHVYNMVLRGAQLTPSEADTVIRYLIANFGPSAREPAAANAAAAALPNGAGKELVAARCATCHDLELVTTVKRSKRDWPAVVDNMVGRGAVATPAEAQTIAAYLAAQFGSN